ncbi:stonustoxin subunit beta-like [Polypterus senegalus]|uniref:stonustoxin subunit beta-like n=1 Tax=Polypterus senegalus TaxID=55291 RepID=UPI001965575B|nr:stonustoxin subunit beta-like [Polypterus senegalus]
MAFRQHYLMLGAWRVVPREDPGSSEPSPGATALTLAAAFPSATGQAVGSDEESWDFLKQSAKGLTELRGQMLRNPHTRSKSQKGEAIIRNDRVKKSITGTVHRWLCLSDGNKEVTHDRTKTKYPNHPERFDCWPQVLCREALTGTRCYWEVECTGESLRIGVAYKGMRRKGYGLDCLGHNDKSWSLFCSNSEYSVCHNNKDTVISPNPCNSSRLIGVYLDWPAGSLSFYRVSHKITLLHRINTSFTEPIYPGFGLQYNSSVAISHLTPSDH